MIQTTVGQLLEAEQALSRLGVRDLPVRTAYHIARLLRFVQAELKTFQSEREKLIRKYGVERPITPDELMRGVQPPIIEVTPEFRQTYSEQVTELLSIPVEIDWKPLSLTSLTAEKVSALDLVLLGPFLEDEADAS